MSERTKPIGHRRTMAETDSDLNGWTDRQLPSGDEVFLDHVGYFVADLDRAGERLERLGFRVSPAYLQSNADAQGNVQPAGTSNRLVVLRRGFIELLAATHETPLADQLRQALGRYAGIHLVALSHDAIEAQRTRLTAAGFPMQEVVHLRRQVQTPKAGEVAWSILRPQPGVMAEGRVQLVKCHTPELVWPAEPAAHENSAEGLTDLLVCVADRQEAAGRFARLANRPVRPDGPFLIVATERGRLLFVEPEAAARFLPRLSLRSLPLIAGQAMLCADLNAAKRALARHEVLPVLTSSRAACVGPADALGAYLLFHGRDLRDPWAHLAQGK